MLNDEISDANTLLKKKNIRQFLPFIIVTTIFVFSLVYFILAYVHNNYFSYYEAKIETNEKLEDYYNLDKLLELESKITEYNKEAKANGKSTIYYSTVTNYKEIYTNSKTIKIDDGYLIRVTNHVFTTTQISSSGRISEGSEKFDKTFKTIFTTNLLIDTSNYHYNYNGIVSYQNPYLVSGIVSGAFFIAFTLLICILLMKGKIKNHDLIYNNETIFRTPFHKNYFKKSVGHFKVLKDIVTIALLFAIMLALKAIKIPSGFGNLGLGLTYLAFAMIGMLYGPVVGIVIGFFSDIIGFFLFPGGYGFFFGYTFSSMLTGFMYGIFFYKTRLSFAKCFYSRLFVNLVINVLLGSIWWSIINNFDMNGYLNYMFIIELPKNLIYLVPQSIFLFIILKPTANVATRFNLVDKEISDNFWIF